MDPFPKIYKIASLISNISIKSIHPIILLIFVFQLKLNYIRKSIAPFHLMQLIDPLSDQINLTSIIDNH